MIRDPEIRFETHAGVQTQVDWSELGPWPLGGQLVELHAMVAILGCSRAPAIRFAVDETRPTSLERLAWCLHDLGGVTREVLTDRDPAFCVGQTADGAAILAPEWVDLARLLGVVPKACRPYRARTKWSQVFADPVVATAIVDRLLHSATVLNIRGRSYRMRAHQDQPDGRNQR